MSTGRCITEFTGGRLRRLIRNSPSSKNEDSSCDSNPSSRKTVFRTTLDGCPPSRLPRGRPSRVNRCPGTSFTKLITDCEETETKESAKRVGILYVCWGGVTIAETPGFMVSWSTRSRYYSRLADCLGEIERLASFFFFLRYFHPDKTRFVRVFAALRLSLFDNEMLCPKLRAHGSRRSRAVNTHNAEKPNSNTKIINIYKFQTVHLRRSLFLRKPSSF